MEQMWNEEDKNVLFKTKTDFRSICFQKWGGKHNLFSREYTDPFPLWNCLETHPTMEGTLPLTNLCRELERSGEEGGINFFQLPLNRSLASAI